MRTAAAAIESYHELLGPVAAADARAHLEEQQHRRGLLFGDRPLCTVLRPRFLSRPQYERVRTRVSLLLSAFDRVHRRALEDDALLAQLRLEPWEVELAREPTGYVAPSPVSRVDAFFGSDGQELRVTEYNAETPAGAGYGDALTDVFLTMPVMAEFLKRWDVRPLPARHHVLHALLRAWREWSGGRRKPRIGILDWAEVPTTAEFRIFADYFRAAGYEAVIGDPRACEHRDGRLYVDGTPVDLVYKRVLISELIEREGLDGPVVRAVRSRSVCMVNPFACKVMHKKASLAVLSDERNADLLGPAEREAVAEHVPWTRVVEERHTQYDGRRVDLLPFIADHREELVLKPNDEYGGKGVVLGWETDDDAWRRAVTAALETPHIVQRRIDLPVEAYPCLAGKGVVIEDRIVDTAPFAFDGAYVDGCLSRLSTESLVNVTAGGGSSLATFVVEPRS